MFPYLHVLVTYLVLVAGLLTFRELAVGRLRQFTTLLALTALLVAVFGIGRFVLTGDEYWLFGLNNFVATFGLVVLLVFFLVPSLGRKYSLIANRRVMLAGAIIFGLEALFTNIVRLVGYQIYAIWGDLGFFILILSLGYVAMQQVYASELRLSSIENELAIARQLQFAILPTTTPQLRNLQIAAAYQPMTAVAGDFYEYLPVDDYRAGFLVADVSGHGVPAALIASMIKVAVQSVAEFAYDPSQLLRRLRASCRRSCRDSSSPPHTFGSTARLTPLATRPPDILRCSAGAPPIAYSSALKATANSSECRSTVTIRCARFFSLPATASCFIPTASASLENAAGEAFGDDRLEQLLRDNRSRPAAELSLLLLNEIRAWQPAATPQEDDITFLVIDVL